MTDTWTHADVRAMCDRISDGIGEWQGIPIPLGEDNPLVLAEGHPMEWLYRDIGQTDDVTVDFVYGEHACSGEDVCEEERVVNEWYSRGRSCRVLVVDRGGRRFALTIPRQKEGSRSDSMMCVAVLCLHPIGYYARSWGGCMVPSDDVIAHLAMMRGDEAFFWRKANQHKPSDPEAGL